MSSRSRVNVKAEPRSSLTFSTFTLVNWGYPVRQTITCFEQPLFQFFILNLLLVYELKSLFYLQKNKPQQLSLEATRNLLVCLLWVLKNMDSQVLKDWWADQPSSRYKEIGSIYWVNNKHLVTGPEGNSKFCFPRKTKSIVSLGTSLGMICDIAGNLLNHAVTAVCYPLTLCCSLRDFGGKQFHY